MLVLVSGSGSNQAVRPARPIVCTKFHENRNAAAPSYEKTGFGNSHIVYGFSEHMRNAFVIIVCLLLFICCCIC